MKLSHLDKLSNLSGVSGDESAVAQEIISKIEGYARWELDPLGNLIVYKEGENRREEPLLLFAPMDEKGLMVSGIEKDGSLKFTRIGDTDRRAIPGHRVKVGANGIPGVIGGKAIHHVHAKDTYLDTANIRKTGVLSTGHYSDVLNRPWTFRTVGYGLDTAKWKEFVSMLRMVGYDGVLSIEHEDMFMSVEEGLEKAIAFLKDIMSTQPMGGMWWA